MNEQVHGLFSSLVNAEQAVAALKDHGVAFEEISVLRQSSGTGLPEVENIADHSFTPTSAGDVVRGAEKGGAVGLAVGLLAGVAALAIPGVGPVLAAGPLWAALGGTLLATAAGAVSGGVAGYLVDQGVPEEAAATYNTALTRGDILVSVRSSQITAADSIMLLQKYGATQTDAHPIALANAGRMEPPVIDRASDLIATTPAPSRAATVSTTASDLRPVDSDAVAVTPVAAQSGLEPIGQSTSPEVVVRRA